MRLHDYPGWTLERDAPDADGLRKYFIYYQGELVAVGDDPRTVEDGTAAARRWIEQNRVHYDMCNDLRNESNNGVIGNYRVWRGNAVSSARWNIKRFARRVFLRQAGNATDNAKAEELGHR